MRLFAGPWVGEFGWELFCWHGFIRTIVMAKDCQEIIVASRPDRAFLYQDFATEFIPITITGGDAHMWKYVNQERQIAMESDQISKTFLEKYKNCKIIRPTKSSVKTRPLSCLELTNENDFKNTFIKFGEKSEEGYDLLFHARNRKWRNQENWSRKNWENLSKLFSNYKIASIGSKKESFHIKKTGDLRGIPLSALVDIMASSKLIVGPSSGPMHLASLCGLTHLVWSGKTISKNRYLKQWNPFQTKVIYYDKEGWHPKPGSVEGLIKNCFTRSLKI